MVLFRQKVARVVLAFVIMATVLASSPAVFADMTTTLTPSTAADADIVDPVATEIVPQNDTLPWWAWPIILFAVTFILGILAVMAGIGGGVLFVPIVSGFFPFHFDFVRGAGLFVALCGPLAAGSTLLRKGMADLKLALPIALITSIGAICGALAGLSLPTHIVQLLLGTAILGVVVVMLIAKKSEFPEVKKACALSTALKISGIYHEESSSEYIDWKIHRTAPALCVFVMVGFAAGMFGMGAGWANVPVLNLMMGVPLKVAVSTSHFLLSITDTSAAWIYFNRGAVMPIIVVPAVIGSMLGSRVGVKILAKTHPSSIRYIVIAMLLLAGLRAIAQGFGI